MASLCRSGGMRLVRSTIFRSNPTPLPSLLRSKPPTPLISRRSICAALDCTGSLMPLHTAIASARLKSFIAANSSIWTCLSHEFGIPR